MSDIPNDIMHAATAAWHKADRHYCTKVDDKNCDCYFGNVPCQEEIEIVAQALLSERQRHAEVMEEVRKEARREALEEAARAAERLGSHLVRGETGPEYVNGNCDVAAAIRALLSQLEER